METSGSLRIGGMNSAWFITQCERCGMACDSELSTNSIRAFYDMLAGDDYQEINKKYRLNFCGTRFDTVEASDD